MDRDRLDPVEVFHEILEHRWFLSERAGRDVGATAARTDYFARILPRVPDDLTMTAPHAGDEPAGGEPAVDAPPTAEVPVVPAPVAVPTQASSQDGTVSI